MDILYDIGRVMDNRSLFPSGNGVFLIALPESLPLPSV